MGRLARGLVSMSVAVMLAACGGDTMEQLEVHVHQAGAQVLTAYKQRERLVPELLDAVDWVMSYEQEVLDELSVAYKQGQVNWSGEAKRVHPQEIREALFPQLALSSALAEFLITTERYPQLRIDPNFQSLVTQLQSAESNIADQQLNYQRQLEQYNDYIETFPHMITAKILGYEKQPLLLEVWDPSH